MKQAHSLYVTRHEEHDANHANHGPIDVVLAVHLVPPEKPPDQEAHRRLTEPQAHISKQKRSKHDTQSNESNKPDKNKPEHKNLLPLPAHSAPLRAYRHWGTVAVQAEHMGHVATWAIHLPTTRTAHDPRTTPAPCRGMRRPALILWLWRLLLENVQHASTLLLLQACATCRIGRARIDHIPAVARRTSTRRVCTMPLCRTLTAVLGPRRPS